MIVTIQPSEIKGIVTAPPSKSAMQRACAAALVCRGMSRICSPGTSNDDLAALDIIRQLGATITAAGDDLLIDSTHNFLSAASSVDEKVLNCNESGLSIRMFTPIAALSPHTITIDGSGSLRSRPMNFFDTVLPQLGVQVSSNKGKLPLQVQGPLIPKNITVDGSLSSQFLTGLLMAYAAANASDVSIEVTDLKSRPYIDLTLQVMQDFGLPVPENRNFQQFYFPKQPAAKTLSTIEYTVEGDWSGAAFLLVAGAIGGSIGVKGLKTGSAQADRKIIEALQACGASLRIHPAIIEVHKAPLTAFSFDATDCPDLFPPLVALAAYCNGKSTLTGVNRLANKESDRGQTLREQFGKLGISILLEGDTMIIEGGAVSGNIVQSCHDHRIAMACAVAAIGAKGNTTIQNAEAINKSYPSFYHHLQDLSVSVTGLS